PGARRAGPRLRAAPPDAVAAVPDPERVPGPPARLRVGGVVLAARRPSPRRPEPALRRPGTVRGPALPAGGPVQPGPALRGAADRDAPVPQPQPPPDGVGEVARPAGPEPGPGGGSHCAAARAAHRPRAALPHQRGPAGGAGPGRFGAGAGAQGPDHDLAGA